ncbi:MAG TPA: SLC13 family permease [Gammaproteobacteria bacterium]|nr:SLC13 family permease [Gammaproteobacteria bacterium]
MGPTVLVGGGLSMVLVNDIVVFAFTPLLCLALRERGLNPRPYLLALAGSANAGSTASLSGNPQNIVIGKLANLDFFNHVLIAAVPAFAGLGFVFAVTTLAWGKPLRNSVPISQDMLHVGIHPWLTTKSFYRDHRVDRADGAAQR